MKYSNDKQSFKSKTLGLVLAAALIPAGLAVANDGYRSSPAVVRSNVSGHVEVVHQVPGGVITVGADWGKQRPAPQVVVVENRRQVVVVEKKHGRGHAYGHRDREVTIVREAPRRNVTVIREEPRRQVTIIKTEPSCPKTVVIEKRSDDHDYDRHDGRYDRQDNRDGHQRNVYVRK
ncbi:MAG: hypothetical protein JWO30_592 [Fibrobacteres bacterium]|nr:hypothetical protein [Fibrobacterota bacterium]